MAQAAWTPSCIESPVPGAPILGPRGPRAALADTATACEGGAWRLRPLNTGPLLSPVPEHSCWDTAAPLALGPQSLAPLAGCFRHPSSPEC